MPSQAEIGIESFLEEPNTLNTLFVSPEAAKEAGKALTDLCDDEMLTHATAVDVSDFPEGYPIAGLRKEELFSDGSNVRVMFRTRPERLPDNHPDKGFTPDELYSIQVTSTLLKAGNPQITSVDYVFDELTGVVRKEVSDLILGIKRAFVLADTIELDELAKGDLSNVDEAVEVGLLADMQSSLGAKELEKSMGLDGSVIVSPEEIDQLRTFVKGMEVKSRGVH
ncbi:MAG: hypothetical protein ABI221_01515 [Candidatus Saccharimonadales bacterium]